MYTNTEIKIFKGLHLQRNSFEVPDGALEEAENCVLYSDYVIEKCRGYYDYYDNADDDLVMGLYDFQGTLISSNDAGMFFYESQGTDPSETGDRTAIPNDPAVEYQVVSSKSRFAQANGNMYTTTDNGVVKLQNIDSAVLLSGCPQGLDLAVYYKVGTVSDILRPTYAPADSTTPPDPNDYTTFQVSYRVLFGYKDLNSNLILSAPSSPVTINNPVVSASITHVGTTITVTSAAHGLSVGMEIFVFYSRNAQNAGPFHVQLDGPYAITSTTANTFTYEVAVPVPLGMAWINYAYEAKPELEFSLPTQCLVNPDPLFTVKWFYQVYRTSIQPTGTNLFDYSVIVEDFVPDPQPDPRLLFVVDENIATGGAFLYTNPNISGELQANYRAPKPTDIALFQGSLFFSNYQTRRNLKASVVDPAAFTIGVANNVYSFFDFYVDDARNRFIATSGVGNHTTLGTCSASGTDLLITSPGHGFVNYGLISVYISDAYGPGNVVQNGVYYVTYISADTFKISASIADKVTPTFVQRQTETSLYFQAIQFPNGQHLLCPWTRTGGVVTISLPGNNLYDGMWVYASSSTSGGGNPIVPNLYTVALDGTATEFTIEDILPDDSGTVTISDEPFCFAAPSSGALGIVQSSQNIVKANNRNNQSPLYSQYLSLTTDLGDFLLQTKEFDDQIRIYASDSQIAVSIYPQIPIRTVRRTTASNVGTTVTVVSNNHGLFTNQNIYIFNASQGPTAGTKTNNVDGLWNITVIDVNTFTFVVSSAPTGGTLQLVDYSFTNNNDYIQSISDDAPNGIYLSKTAEPEAVPVVNFILVGDKSPIRRIHALSNSLIILKDDGVFRVTGDNVNNFSVNLLDSSVRIVAYESSAILNNQVIFLSNQGVAMTTDTSVQIVSRQIDDVIQSILTRGELDFVTSAFSNEVDRLYLLTTTTPNYVIPDFPNPPLPSALYVYNTMTESWTTWEWLFSYGTVGPNQTVYIVDALTGNIQRERRLNKKTDYMGQNYPIAIVSVDESRLFATVKIPFEVGQVSYTPKSGDAILKYGIINLINDVTQIDTTTFVLSLYDPGNLVGGEELVGWSRTSNTVSVFAPNHGLQENDNIFVYFANGIDPPTFDTYRIFLIDSNQFYFDSTGSNSLGNLSYYEVLDIYSSYKLTAKFSPFHGGMVGRSKQFCQFKAQFRSADCTAATLTFAGDTYPTSEPVYWQRVLEVLGWGLFPWGLVPWGQPTDDDLPVGTQPASILRTYVPATAARGTFIQPSISNEVAGDRVSIQSLSYDVRAYGSRPSK
jgi:hypothetical protein